jgi:excisionase family DNA binding protein
MGELYTLSEAAKLLGVSRPTFATYIKQGRIPYTKKGGVVLIKGEDLEKLLRIKKEWYSLKRTMEEIGISKQTIFTLVRKGKLHPVRLGKFIYFNPAEVEEIKKEYIRKK